MSKLLINCRDLSYFSSLGASEQSTSESENWDLRQLNWTVKPVTEYALFTRMRNKNKYSGDFC
ncbi:MAG: hypothetical protein Ct9H90mP8_2510 [Pseudomonadota bacterium]|nr:MAG: hypothetical protein Ct9H90mP8_2510 [Pseudomonadota bacterium]